MALGRRLQRRYVEGIGAGNLADSTAAIAAWYDAVQRIPGLVYHLDPYRAGTLNAVVDPTWREPQSDAPVMCSTGAPKIVNNALNTRYGFSWLTGPVTFTDKQINAPLAITGGIKGTFTAFIPIQGAASSLNGSGQRILLSSYDDNGQQFFFGTRSSGTPQLLMGHNGAANLFWVFGSKLVAGSVHLLAVTVNEDLGEMKIFADYPQYHEAIATGLTITSSPAAKWYIGGQQLGSTCWQGIIGSLLIFEGVDLSTLDGGRHLDRLFAAAKTFYLL